VRTFDGYTDYIMNIAFNLKYPNTFPSSCLDRTVTIWNLGSPNASHSLKEHEQGVNFVSFHPGPEKPYLVTIGDYPTVKIWDYLSKACIQTMEGHNSNVFCAVFHPSLPLIVSGSEDGSVMVWNSGTYRCETTLSYALERAWCVSLNYTSISNYSWYYVCT
jgi:coatomer subunit beta'